MKDLPPLPTTPTSAKAWNASTSPKTPLRPSPTPHQSKYSHPYGIKSTSSGVLSSAAVSSSPNNAISAHSYQQHKSSKSMHSLLRNSSSVDDLAGCADDDADSSVRRADQRHRNEGIIPGLKYDSINTRKRTLAQRASMSDLSGIVQESPGGMDRALLASPRKRVTELRDEWSRVGVIRGEDGLSRREGPDLSGWPEDLPKDPKQWTTAQLALFIECALRQSTPHFNLSNQAGNHDRNIGEAFDTPSTIRRNHHLSLPVMLVEDIKGWIHRTGIDGKAFLYGSDGDWAVSDNPPPFLPILLSLSTELRHYRSTKGTPSRNPAFSLGKAHDPFRQHSKTTADDQHLTNSRVLRETNENDDPHGPSRDCLPGIVVQPHVREVAELIDKRIFDDIQSPLLADKGHDIFSPLVRPKLRTLSSSSARSTLSVLSSDASDGVCVSERAALFESGEVGRHASKTAEEREGRVLEHKSPSDAHSTSLPTSSPESQSEEDVFGMTIRPSMVSRFCEASRDNGVIAIVSEPMATVPLGTPIDLLKGDAVTRPKVFEEDRGQPSQSDTSESSSDNVIPVQSNTDHARSGGAEFTAVTSIMQDVSAFESQTLDTSSRTDLPQEVAQPSHMAHMIAHEQAGRKPYGALRRAYSTPVPQLSEQRKICFSGKDCAQLPGAGTLTALPGLSQSPRQDLCARVFSLGLAPSPDNREAQNATLPPFLRDGKDASRAISFNLLKTSDTVTGAGKSTYSPSLRDQPALKEMTDRLAVAESRITELEGLLAKLARDKVILQKQLAPKPATEGESLESGDSTSVTGPWRWLAIHESISPFASRFGPPQTLGQLPGYVFLVGVGLSVIVAKVVFSHSLARGK